MGPPPWGLVVATGAVVAVGVGAIAGEAAAVGAGGGLQAVTALALATLVTGLVWGGVRLLVLVLRRPRSLAWSATLIGLAAALLAVAALAVLLVVLPVLLPRG